MVYAYTWFTQVKSKSPVSFTYTRLWIKLFRTHRQCLPSLKADNTSAWVVSQTLPQRPKIPHSESQITLTKGYFRPLSHLYLILFPCLSVFYIFNISLRSLFLAQVKRTIWQVRFIYYLLIQMSLIETFYKRTQHF